AWRARRSRRRSRLPLFEQMETRLMPTAIQLSASSYLVNQASGTVSIGVTLDAASGQTITVDYATSDGSAAAGSDYTATSGTLTFNPSVTSRSFSVPI